MPKRQISAKDALESIQQGLDDFSLMRRYRITARGLQSLFYKLVAAGLLTPDDIESRYSFLDETVQVVWTCPQCGVVQKTASERCPSCQAKISRLTDTG